MAAAENNSGAKGTSGHLRLNMSVDRFYGAFRRQLRTVAIGLLLVNLALGLFARQQQRATIEGAIDIFDNAFISTNYVHLAQMSFQRYADERIHARTPDEIAKSNELLDNVLEEMDVTIAKASSDHLRALGLAVRTRIADLASTAIDPADLPNRVANLHSAMEQLSERNTAVGLMARDQIEEFSFKSNLLLLGSIVTSIMLASLALMLLHRMISSLNRRSSAQLSAALEGMPQGLSMFDSELRLIVCNVHYAEMYALQSEHTEPGTPLRKILEHRLATGTPPVNADNFVEDSLAAAANPSLGVAEQQLHDGRIISVISAPLTTGGSVTIHMDVTEKRNSEKQIAFLAHHDALTGLANRVQLRDYITENLRQQSKRFCVLSLDLDHFKDVNDTLGHSVGDALLCAVAQRLRNLAGEEDLVSRTGGDEFSIVHSPPAHPMAAASDLAARLVEALGVPFELGDHHVVVGASVGIVVAPDDGSDTDQLLKNADMALYRAKDDGRGGFHFFEPDMDAKAQARRLLELDLRKAAACGEFELFYQPIVNLAENRISGLEALLRWNHPTRGRVSPAEFIPLAEETGLILQIGAWVMRQACNEAMHWPSELRVAVNVSPVQFRSKNLVSLVTSALAASGLAPNRLEIEITETVLLHNNDATLAMLHQLRNLGVRISMDDFGTGYSSLSYLRSFPFDKIKIDQSFIRDLIAKPDSIAIIRAVTSLGHSFGMTTTAEGVETREQLDQMRAEGCTEVQGFIYSKPMPASGIAELLARFAAKAQAAA